MKKILLMLLIVSVVIGVTVNTEAAVNWRFGTKEVQGRLVYYDATYPQTWLDVKGPDVVKYVNEFVGSDIPITTTAATDPPGWLLTAITGEDAATEITAGTTYSGEMQVVPDGTSENDGFNLHLEGEAFILATGKPLYFGIRLKMIDADQSDLIVGLFVIDTGIWGGVTDGVYFSNVDEAATLSFTTEKDSSPDVASAAAGTLTETYKKLEFYFDGAGTIKAYVDNTLVATTSTEVPNDEALTFAIEILTGETTANGVIIDWLRIFQIR